jgi:hypothetical protein
VSEVRRALEDLVEEAGIGYRMGRRVVRVAVALEGKDDAATYWREKGRDRFARELAEDEIPEDVAQRALAVVDQELDEQVDLGAILEDLRRRIT